MWEKRKLIIIIGLIFQIYLFPSCPAYAMSSQRLGEGDSACALKMEAGEGYGETTLFCAVRETSGETQASKESEEMTEGTLSQEITDEDIADFEQEILGELDFDAADGILSEAAGAGGKSFAEILDSLLRMDDAELKTDLFQALSDYAFGDMKEFREIFVKILLMTVAFAVFRHFIRLFENSQISKTGFYMYFLILMVLMMKSYLVMEELLSQVLEQIVALMQALIPTLAMTMVFASAQTAAAVFYQIAVVVIWLVERLLIYVAAPAIHIYVVLQMLNCMTGEKVISRFTVLLKKSVRWLLRALLAGVTGMNIIENMIAPSLDNLKKISITKTLSMIPGLGGMTEAVSNLFLGSAAVIKNGVGAAAMVAFLLIVLGPVVKLVVFTLVFKLAGAVVQPFADGRVCGCIDSAGDGAALLLRTMVTGVLLFLITIAIAITAGGIYV